jgi:DNA uptake protein ComE-like DNA-binding protein
MKKILLSFILIFFVNAIFAEELYEYFYKLSKEVNSESVKISFLEKSLNANPTYKKAYTDLMKIYSKNNNYDGMMRIKSDFENNIEEPGKFKSAEVQNNFPIKPAKKKASVLKKVFYITVGVAVVGAASYYGWKYYQKYKKEKEIKKIEKNTNESDKSFNNKKKEEVSNEETVKNDDIKEPIKIIIPEPEKVVVPVQKPQKYDLNFVTVEQLMTLPGCDRLTAELIVKYRKYYKDRNKTSGNAYKSNSDLLNIPVINKNKLKNIMPYLYVAN